MSSRTCESNATRLAHQLMARHGLTDWSFRFDHARQRCGSCNFSRKRISVSRHLLANNDLQEFTATVLHEIAHALVGPGHGHGPRWRAAAARIGAPTSTTNSTARMPAPRWGLWCRQCRVIIARRHRRRMNLQAYRCGGCRSVDSTLEWVEQVDLA